MASAKWLLRITLPCLSPSIPRPKSLPGTAAAAACVIGPSGPKGDDRMKDVFDHLDVDKDGKISSRELTEYLASVGEWVSPTVAERVVSEFDSDGDELLDLGDFLRLMRQEEESSEWEEVLRSAFEMFEAERGCGCITPQGLQQMLRQLGDVKSHDQCAAMIRPFDLDGNGFLDFHEFHRMMSPP